MGELFEVVGSGTYDEATDQLNIKPVPALWTYTLGVSESGWYTIHLNGKLIMSTDEWASVIAYLNEMEGNRG